MAKYLINAELLTQIEDERRRQLDKFGVQNHVPAMWTVILGEEYGEACKEALEARFAKTEVLAAERLVNFRAEMIQVAAVAIAMIESLDRNEMEYYGQFVKQQQGELKQ